MHPLTNNTLYVMFVEKSKSCETRKRICNCGTRHSRNEFLLNGIIVENTGFIGCRHRGLQCFFGNGWKMRSQELIKKPYEFDKPKRLIC